MSGKTKVLKRRALRVEQKGEAPLFSFTLTGEEILKIAEISRVARSEGGKLIGYQRPEVRRHVQEISTYLDSEAPLLPNSIILALSSDAKFKSQRGPGAFDGCATSGVLEIPVPASGRRKPGWIVDGQQRALALSKSKRKDFPVPVNAFLGDDLQLQRDQFIRVNNTRPLPSGLVTELLPEVDTLLPRKLAVRKIPSELCDLLNRDPESPFVGMIKRASTPKQGKSKPLIQDTSIIKMLQESLQNASGCLFPYRNMATGETDFPGIRNVLHFFWDEVREAFPEAWGKPPAQSRLMHGAGICAMGRLMDRVMGAVNPSRKAARTRVRKELALLAPHCAWTHGHWPNGTPWKVQNTPSDKKALTNELLRLYMIESVGGL